MSIRIYEDANFMRMSLGDFGFDLISSTSLPGTNFYGAIQATTDTVISFENHIEGEELYDVDNLSMPTGFIIFGNITNVDVTSGIVIAYKRG